ncbi:hypothetical protein ACQEV4_19340 [Streptomyces shenzhenensis]|uniref:hypothetical protein n=1 Tax=Streptomyces shenzhenensis TaxID=943815 RepID=UPI003D8D3ABA
MWSRTRVVFVRSDADQLAGLVARVDAGTLHVHVAERVTLPELPAVHARSNSGTLPGKRVITVCPVPTHRIHEGVRSRHSLSTPRSPRSSRR